MSRKFLIPLLAVVFLTAPAAAFERGDLQSPAVGKKTGVGKPTQGITLHHEGQYLHKKLPGKMKSGQ